jgi:hypothetical protein
VRRKLTEEKGMNSLEPDTDSQSEDSDQEVENDKKENEKKGGFGILG